MGAALSKVAIWTINAVTGKVEYWEPSYGFLTIIHLDLLRLSVRRESVLRHQFFWLLDVALGGFF